MDGSQGNRFGFDVRNPDYDDSRFVEQDYSIGGGVTMENRDFEHGFRKEVNKYDRVRGIQGTRRGEYYGKGPKNWKKSDEKIREEVCEALYFNPHIDASDIDVTVQEGSVSLKGWVEDRESKREAELCADQVAGVVDVDNEIHLRNRKT